MKKSMFVVERTQPNGDCVLFCAETASIVVLNPNALELWRNEDWDNFPVFEDMKRMKFIVDDEEDQIEVQRQIRNFVKEPREVKMLSFVIAPTMFCNARCAYCFEKNSSKSRMRLETEIAMVDFIINTTRKYSAQKIAVTWFGGEPLLEQELIRRVSKALIDAVGKDNYYASITTNGSLIDDNVVELFKDCNITRVQITIDGTEENYNRIKNYKNADKFNYQSVIRSIERCLENEILVTIRLNISVANYSDVRDVLEQLAQRFEPYRKRLHIYAFPIMGDKGDETLFQSGSPELKEALNGIYKRLFELGYKDSYKSLGLKARPVHCAAFRYHSYSIDPFGDIFRCEHHLGCKEWSVGDVFDGIDESLPRFRFWLEPEIPEKCNSCKILPMCQGGCVMENGTNLDACSKQMLTLDTSLDLAYRLYERG